MKALFPVLLCFTLSIHPELSHAEDIQEKADPELQRVIERYNNTSDKLIAERQAILYEIGTLGKRAAPAVPILIQVLEDTRHNRGPHRDQASKSLIRIGAPAVAAVIQFLKEENIEHGSNRRFLRAWKILSGIGIPAVPALIQELHDTNPISRRRAAKILGNIGKDAAEAVPELVNLLDDDTYYVSFYAGAALAEIGEASIPYMIDRLKSGDPRYREKSAEILGLMGPEGRTAVPHLVDAMGDPTDTVRQTAAIALATIGEEYRLAAPVLMIIVRDGISDQLWSQAASLLAKCGSQDSTITVTIEKLLANRSGAKDVLTPPDYTSETDVKLAIYRWGLKNPRAEIRRLALEALRFLGRSAYKQTIEDLAACLEDTDSQVRKDVAEGLINFFYLRRDRDTAMMRALMSVIANGPPDIAGRAVGALKEFGETATVTIPFLLDTLRHATPSLMDEIQRTLAEISGPSIEMWIPMLKNEDTNTRLVALRRLEGEASQVGSVLEELSELANDPDTDVRYEATRIVSKIRESRRSADEVAIHSVQDTNIRVRLNGALSLIRMDTHLAPAYNTIADILNIGDSNIRLDCVKEIEDFSLRQIERHRVVMVRSCLPLVPQLLIRLMDDCPEIRMISARALIVMAFEVDKAVKVLAELIDNATNPERLAALEALNLSGVHARSVIPSIEKSLTNPNWEIRELSATTLIRLGERLDSAIDVLLENARDTRIEVSQSATARLSTTKMRPFSSFPHRLRRYVEEQQRRKAWNIEQLPDMIEMADSDLPELYYELTDSRPARRQAAARAIGEFPQLTRQSADALMRTLDDDDTNVQYEVSEQLFHFKHYVDEEEFIRFLNNSSSREARRFAAGLLAQWNNVQPLYNIFLNDPQFSVVYYSHYERKLWRIIGESADGETFLINAVKDTWPEVRKMAIMGLGVNKAAAKRTVPIVVQSLRDPSKSVRLAAAVTLHQLDDTDSSTSELLQEALEDPDLRDQAAEILSRLKTQQSIRKRVAEISPDMIQILKGDDVDAIITGCEEISIMGEGASAVTPQLIELLTVDTRVVRQSAIKALSSIGAPAVPSLINALSSTDWRVRREIIMALLGMRQAAKESISALIRLTRDEYAIVREKAVLAITHIADANDSEVIQLLEKLSGDTDRNMRSAALAGLTELRRPDARPAEK